MRNVKTEIKDNKLIVTVDLKAVSKPSASGKSMVIASTEGNVAVASTDGVRMELNVYTQAEEG